MSSKEPVAPPVINPGKLALRLLRELTWERGNIKREPDLPRRIQKFRILGEKLEFLLRVVPELNSCIDVEWQMINFAIEEVEKEIQELRDDGEGWKVDN